MNTSQIYIVLSVAVLVIIALLGFFIASRKQEKAFTSMTILAFGFILTGMLFGNNRLFNYSMMGIGVILSIVDMARKLRAKNET